MLCVYDHLKYFHFFSAGTIFIRQNLTSTGGRFSRLGLKTVSALKGLNDNEIEQIFVIDAQLRKKIIREIFTSHMFSSFEAEDAQLRKKIIKEIFTSHMFSSFEASNFSFKWRKIITQRLQHKSITLQICFLQIHDWTKWKCKYNPISAEL